MTASRAHLSGTDRYYLDLLRELPNVGVGVRGMVIGEPALLDAPVPGVESFATETSGRLARWVSARRTMARLLGDAKLVVSHGAPHTFYALDKIGRRPLVVHFHGPWALEGEAEGISRGSVLVRKIQENVVYRRAARFIVLSRSFADILANAYGVPEKKIRIIPGGVDLRRFTGIGSRAEARRRLELPEHRPIVLATRRLEPTKGVGALVDAMAEVRAAVPEVLCAITGTGSLADDLRRRAHALGLDETVRFLGHVDDAALPSLYAAADVTVLPSIAWEGFGLSVIESLACGTPALVTPVGGMPDAVRDLDPSLVLASSSSHDIAAGLIAALRERGRLPSREACIAYARRFGWSTIAARVSDVYREVA
jgi:glycosyltransferase involved in cell wall biosynthesis